MRYVLPRADAASGRRRSIALWGGSCLTVRHTSGHGRLWCCIPEYGRLLCVQWPKALNTSLEEMDPELFDIIEHEKNRQWKVCCPCDYQMELNDCVQSFASLKYLETWRMSSIYPKAEHLRSKVFKTACSRWCEW